MQNLKIKIKAFEIYADADDRAEVVDAIMLYLEEVSEENFFTAQIIEAEDEDDIIEEEGV